MEWKKFRNSNYEVSVNGIIRNIKTKRVIKCWINNKGYSCVELRIENKRSKFLAHRVIAETFIENLENKPQVDHIDRNKTNNVVSNLRWATINENLLNKNYNNYSLKKIKTIIDLYKNGLNEDDIFIILNKKGLLV